MARPVTLFTGQWADLPFETMCQKAKSFGYDGVELACWGDHFDVDQCLSPVGGLSMWEASLEMRIDVMDPFSVALFCDASDVSPNQVDLRLLRLHRSCGPGARVDTPVGPIRLDVGYRIPGLQNLEDANDPLEKDPGELFSIPIAVSFGIGEAF